jgi:hypothetical protein
MGLDAARFDGEAHTERSLPRVSKTDRLDYFQVKTSPWGNCCLFLHMKILSRLATNARCKNSKMASATFEARETSPG